MTSPNTIPFLVSTEYETSDSAFRFTFSPRFVRAITTTLRDHVKVLQSQFPEFSLDFDGSAGIGIGECLRFIAPRVFRYTLPRFYVNPERCHQCQGTGHSDGVTCFPCEGKGIIWNENMGSRASFSDFGRTLYAISELLDHLIHLFNRPHPSSHEDSVRQTMSFQIDKTGGYDSDMKGWLDDEVIIAARSFSENEKDMVREAMRSVNDRLYAGKNQYSLHHFCFYHKTHFELQIPGSHSALILKNKESSWFRGQNLCCHNVDGRSSQIMLLAGLATINRIARKQIGES